LRDKEWSEEAFRMQRERDEARETLATVRVSRDETRDLIQAAEKRVSEAEALASEVGKVAGSIQANAKEDPTNTTKANWAERLQKALSAWEEGKK
jgi:hypothetical protein